MRFDYSNALGESYRDPAFDQPGRETLGFKGSAAVDDIKFALGYASERVGEHAHTVLVGMSFSGPFCMRVAATDSRVSQLVQIMGASDIQDVTRTTSAGIDFIANYRAGIRMSHHNVLGVLSNPDTWVADGLRNGLCFLSDVQRDASSLSTPVVWIHGEHDAFVNVRRVRSVLEAATQTERHLVSVPCGHVPTQTSDAILAYLPAVSEILERAGVESPRFALPDPREVKKATDREWERAPKVALASPRSYWRDYMLGAAEDSLGFDILSMLPEYKTLMAKQVALLDLQPGVRLSDFGAGLGHALPYVNELPCPERVSVHLFDLVPELLEEARRRHGHLSAPIKTTVWDAASEPVPTSARGSDRILDESLSIRPTRPCIVSQKSG